MQTIQARLQEQKIVIPQSPAPAANYVPYMISRNHVFISGQLPLVDGKLLHKGKVGQDVSLETAREAARICGLNVLGALQDACHGDLDKVQQCIRIGGFVNATPDFVDHPKVINGVSDLMVEVFGLHSGHHSRVAVGCASLPLGACVEVEALFYIR